MSKKTIEHAASVLKEIKAEVNSGVIKNQEIQVLCSLWDVHAMGFAVILTLSTKYKHHSTILEEWRKRLEADEYVIRVSRNQLIITFCVMYR